MMTDPADSSQLRPIVCAVDDGYVSPLCVFMQSLSVAHSGQRIRLIVIHQEMSEANRRRVLFHADRLGLDVELRGALRVNPRYPVTMWGTGATYIRLDLPEVVPEAPVVLYLDVDVLVLRDLGPLLNRQLDGVPLAAVRDPLSPTLGTGFGLPGWQALGLAGSREYFNTGVMLVNLAECRQRGIFEESHRFACEMPQHILFWDQDAINWAVADEWSRLERCWNTLSISALLDLYKDWKYCAEDILPFSQLIEDEETAAVLHYAGPIKPWTSKYPAGPQRDLYSSFARLVEEHEP
jgi:UDP-D-galactose:(glucosyl)LPS alpha-1,3-D-galactosyltransferase